MSVIFLLKMYTIKKMLKFNPKIAFKGSLKFFQNNYFFYLNLKLNFKKISLFYLYLYFKYRKFLERFFK